MINEAIAELRTELNKAGGGSLRPASDEDLEQARLFGLPPVLVDFYHDNEPNATDGVVELDQKLWSVQRVIEENRDFVPGVHLFPLGYVVFASNGFGDAYCIDTVHVNSFGEYPVVIFPHDVIEAGASLDDVEHLCLTVATNLEDFLRQFAGRTLVEDVKYD